MKGLVARLGCILFGHAVSQTFTGRDELFSMSGPMDGKAVGIVQVRVCKRCSLLYLNRKTNHDN